MIARFALLLLLFLNQVLIAQKGFDFINAKEKVVIPFKLINNLIFIPILVNGIELNFLLDTGVEETILLSLEDKTEVSLNNVKKIKLKGLGSNDAIEGLKSSNNILKIKDLIDVNHELYIVLDQDFNFSAHIGIPVNGIIGYHFFKNQVVEVNYDKKKLIIYQDKSKIKQKRLSKFEIIPLDIQINKPYCNTFVTVKDLKMPAKVLLDLGNSDAFWFFQDANPNLQIPNLFFEDYLGRGFSGDIHGKRTKISSVQLGTFKLNKPIIALPDSISIKSVNLVKGRAGSIGGGILKRFTAIFDYPNSTLYLKTSSTFFDEFKYNRSGIEIVSSGLEWVPETVKLATTFQDNIFDAAGNRSGSANFQYKFELKPVYEIANVRNNSPAKEAGLQKGDIVERINNTSVHNFSLQQINELLQSEEGKILFFEINRNGKNFKFKFQTKELL